MSQSNTGNTNCFNTDNSINYQWNNCTIADEDSGILDWLSPLEPQKRHYDIRTRRVDEVGDWLLETKEYQNWLGDHREDGSDCSALFCYGDPGVGKSYISSLVIDTLCKQVAEKNAGVACFYFDFAVQQGQSPDAVLGSLLKHIIGGLNKVPEGISTAFQRQKEIVGGQKLMLSETVKFLQDIASSRRTFICIDALDEYQDSDRVELLDSLNEILQKAPSTRLFLTGRPHIRGEVKDHLAGRAAMRSIKPTKNDIVTFLRAKLKKDTRKIAMDRILEEEILQKIPETVSEIFLLASLSINAILRETTISRRRQRLTAMQGGLGVQGAYGEMLERIKAQDDEKGRLGKDVLMWISHSRRPLQVDEICHALGVQIGSKDLDRNNIPAISTMLDCCQGLVTIENGTSVVRLIHYTLQEYLRTHPDLFDKTHSTMAETCLTYLNFQCIKNLSADPSPDPRDMPFLKYSSVYWGIHMRAEHSELAKTFALQYLNTFDSHISAKFLWQSIEEGFDHLLGIWSSSSEGKRFSALHCISYFGIAKVAEKLISAGKWDVNKMDDAGMTPLIRAAICGHEEVVRLLLKEKHIQPDQRSPADGRTALSWAAGCGHEGVVRLFLGRQFVNPGKIGRIRGAPLVVGKLFGQRYVNPDSPDKYGQTPLPWAARNGHEGIVRLLLERKDVNPNSQVVEYGRTPLSRAAENGYEGIVKLLLDRKNVNPDTPDTLGGKTPLSWAAGKGHEGIVKLLLAREDVNPDTLDKNGRTPLSSAAENGHEGIVKLLLDRKDVNPDTPDTYHDKKTPLSWAAENGHEGIVKLFLDRKNVNPDTPDTYHDKTPLSRAAENGHEGIVKLFLDRKDVNPDTPGKFGRTPLSWASENGREGTVKMLLDLNDVNPDTPDTKSGRTPLSFAAAMGHQRIVKLLLDRNDVSPDTPDTEYGQTPLAWAAKNGREGVVALLLGREDVDPNSVSKSGITPLTHATKIGYSRVAKLLRAHGGRASR